MIAYLPGLVNTVNFFLLLTIEKKPTCQTTILKEKNQQFIFLRSTSAKNLIQVYHYC